MPSRTQPRARPNYDWDNDGGSSKQGAGMYILKSSIQAQVKKPSWFGTETIFRPFPCVSFDKPETEFEPYRLVTTENCRFSDWIRRYVCAWGVGNPAITYLIPKKHKLYDPWTSPLGILWRAIDQACKKGHQNIAEWQPLRESGMNKGRALKGPSSCYLMQGALLKHDKTEYGGKAGPPLGWAKNPTCVLACSGDTGGRLEALLNQVKPEFKGAASDFENRYVHGDPVSPLFGRYFHFWERGSNAGRRYGSEPSKLASAFESTGEEGGQAGAGGANKTFQPVGFDVEIAATLDSKPATFNKGGEEQIRQHWQHWDDMLYFPNEAEQAHLLFTCFPVSACLYAFGDVNKDWIPEDAIKKDRKAVSVSVPGGNKADPGFGDGWGMAPANQTGPANPMSGGVDPAADAAFFGGNGAAEDATVPPGVIPDDEPASGEPEPVAPAAQTPQIDNTKDGVAKLAALKNQVNKK